MFLVEVCYHVDKVPLYYYFSEQERERPVYHRDRFHLGRGEIPIPICYPSAAIGDLLGEGDEQRTRCHESAHVPGGGGGSSSAHLALIAPLTVPSPLCKLGKC